MPSLRGAANVPAVATVLHSHGKELRARLNEGEFGSQAAAALKTAIFPQEGYLQSQQELLDILRIDTCCFYSSRELTTV